MMHTEKGEKTAEVSPAVRRVGERSRVHFESGFFCAESVLLAVAEEMGIDSPLIPRIATGFCGGLSRTSGPCGALTGGVLAINLCFGRKTPDASRDLDYVLVRKLIREFETNLGSSNCTDLLGCDISTPEGTRVFKDRDMLKTRCLPITVAGAEMTMTLIEKAENGEIDAKMPF